MIHKLFPTRWERIARRLRWWWQDNGLAVVMIANLVWLVTFWIGLSR